MEKMSENFCGSVVQYGYCENMTQKMWKTGLENKMSVEKGVKNFEVMVSYDEKAGEYLYQKAQRSVLVEEAEVGGRILGMY